MIDILKQLYRIANLYASETTLEHNLFQKPRWWSLFNSEPHGSILAKIGEYWILTTDSEFKNYNDEISAFINFISPYVVGRKKHYIGWKVYEGAETEEREHLHIIRYETKVQKKSSI